MSWKDQIKMPSDKEFKTFLNNINPVDKLKEDLRTQIKIHEESLRTLRDRLKKIENNS